MGCLQTERDRPAFHIPAFFVSGNTSLTSLKFLREVVTEEISELGVSLLETHGQW